MVAIEDYPTSLLLLHLGTPHRFTGQTLETGHARAWFRLFRQDFAVLKRKYGIGEFAAPSLDALALSQTLAKIAHAYATAKLGSGEFTPVLLPFLRGEEDEKRFHYVGGSLDDCPASDSLHEIDLRSCKHGDDDCLLVRIRLFAYLGAPLYWVFAGLLKPGHRLQPQALW